MLNRRCALILLAASAGLASCSKDDPLASLEAAVQRLQDNLEAKKTGDVLGQLHSKFRAQGELDKDWAKQTMTGMFLRYANIKMVAVTRTSRDPRTCSTFTEPMKAPTTASRPSTCRSFTEGLPSLS